MFRFLLFLSLFLASVAHAQIQVTVRVLDAQNAPVAGASVAVESWLATDPGKTVPPLTTDAGGTASFEAPTSPGGKIQGEVSVMAPGFGFGHAALKDKTLEIRLEPGAIWRGKVTDETGKPIAGAEVKVTGAMLGRDWETRASLVGKKHRAAYTLKSGADGSFAIRDVPAKLELQWSVNHPDYARKSGRGAVPATEIAVKLAPGAAIRGRVLDLAGQPLSGATVYASPSPFGEGGNNAETDDKGAFLIPSLAAGLYNIGVQMRSVKGNEDFVLPGLRNVAVEAGKVAEAPELRAVAGVEIRGVVREAKTKAPVAGAHIYAQNGDENGGSGDSDAAGRFQFRVLAGRYKVYVSGAPEGYIRPEEQQSVTAGDAAPAELFFDLKKPTTLRGQVVDEAGQPVQAKIKANANYAPFDAWIESDAAGRWQLQPEADKPLQLAGADAEDGYFEVVSPLTIDPATETPTTITVRKVPWQVLPGRALSFDGKPVEGVQIEGSFSTPMGDGNGVLNSHQRSATSNANGDFVLPRIRDGIQSNSNFFRISGKKDGFAFVRGGELSKNGPVWQVSDFIFVPLNLQIEGKTAPGARVTAAGVEALAGADGAFKLDGLPATETRVYAFKGRDFGGANAKSPVQIPLAPQGLQARDSELARDIWNDILAESQRGNKGRAYDSASWITRRLATVEKLDFAAQLAKTTSDMELARLIGDFAGKVPFAALEPAFALIKSDDMRLYSYLDAAAKSDDKALGARALREAATNFAAPEKDAWWREMNLYRAAAVAAKWEGETAGFAALDRAVAFTMKNHGTKSTRQDGMPGAAGRDEIFAMTSEIIAPGGLAMVRRLMSHIEAGAGYEVRALGEAIPILAQADVESVLPLLDELERMAEPVKRDEGHSMAPQWAFARAASKIIPLLGAKSPEKALALARRVRDETYGSEIRWAALSSAAKFQTGDAAAKLWREIVGGASAASAPRYAARAWQLDPALGRELFEIARLKVEGEVKTGMGSHTLRAGYAFYFARENPAQARFGIEREWGEARQKFVEGEELGALALAMAVIDASRAWQMAREIAPDVFSAGFEARRKIGLYLDAEETLRRDFPFGRQGNWDEWREIDGG